MDLWGSRLQIRALLAVVLNGRYAVEPIVTLVCGFDLPSCGCYGVFFPQPLRWYSSLEDFVLGGICLLSRVGSLDLVGLLTRHWNGRSEEVAAHLSIEVREIG